MEIAKIDFDSDLSKLPYKELVSIAKSLSIKGANTTKRVELEIQINKKMLEADVMTDHPGAADTAGSGQSGQGGPNPEPGDDAAEVSGPSHVLIVVDDDADQIRIVRCKDEKLLASVELLGVRGCGVRQRVGVARDLATGQGYRVKEVIKL